MRFWQALSFTEPEQLVEVARLVEAAGFDGAFVSDHVCFPAELRSRYPYSPDGNPLFGPDTAWPEPFTTIGAMAAVTTRLRFVIGVYILPLRHPLEVAKAAATVAVLSGGRFALGVGSGWMREEFDALGREFRGRGRRLDEAVDVMRAVWRGGMVGHEGPAYPFPPLQLSPLPPAPIAILVGGMSARALARAGRLGDGWIGAGNALADVPGIMARLEAHRREAGRLGEPFETIVALTEPAGPDQLRRLEDAGVTGVVSWPFAYTVGPTSTLAQKRQALEDYARQVIDPLR